MLPSFRKLHECVTSLQVAATDQVMGLVIYILVVILLLSWWTMTQLLSIAHDICTSIISHGFPSIDFTKWPFRVRARPSTADMSDTADICTVSDTPYFETPLLDTTKRTQFRRSGCTVYGYPSSGGILIKEEVNIVDMQFLQLDRFSAADRSWEIVQEDEFCARMRRIGATWWKKKEEWIEVSIGIRKKTALESRQLIFGWPTNGEGVWFLKYGNVREMPEDFRRIDMAMDMDERCEVMREYGTTIYADPEMVKEWL